MDLGQCHLKSLEKREKHEEKEEKTKENKIETSAEKLRKLLKEEKRKKKRKRSSSSSSSTSSSESSSSSASHKKHKKRKRNRKHSTSSSRSRKHSSSVPAREDEQLTPPAHTSASFLKQDYRQICDNQERPRKSLELKTRKRSLSSSSLEFVDAAGGRSEDSRESYSSAKTHASGGTSKSAASSSKYRLGRRDSTDSYSRRAEMRHRPDLEDCQKDLNKSVSRKSDSYQSKYSVPDYGTSERRPSGGSSRSYEQSLQGSANTSHKEAQNGSKDTSKALPGNLLNLFNQIAEFEKEKGVKQKFK